MQKQLRQWNNGQEYYRELTHWIEQGDIGNLAVFEPKTKEPIYRAWLQSMPKKSLMKIALQCVRSVQMPMWERLVACLPEEKKPNAKDYHRLAISNEKAELYPVYRALDWIQTPMPIEDQQYMLSRWYSMWCNKAHTAKIGSFRKDPNRNELEFFSRACIGMMAFLSDHPMNGAELFRAASAGGKRLSPSENGGMPGKMNNHDRTVWMHAHAPLVNGTTISYADTYSTYAYVWGEILRNHPNAAECFFLMHELQWCTKESAFGNNEVIETPDESIEEMRIANGAIKKNTSTHSALLEYFKDTFYPMHQTSNNFRSRAFSTFEKQKSKWPGIEITDALRYLESLRELTHLQSAAMSPREKWNIYKAVYPGFDDTPMEILQELDISDLEW